MRRFRSTVLGAALLAAMLLVAACGSGGDDDDSPAAGDTEERPAVTVGAVDFAENRIVAEMYALVLENAGYEVDRQLTLGSREILQPALESGEIHVAPEYLGSLLLFLDAEADATGDPDNNAALLADLLQDKDQELLEYSEANDTNAFVVTQETADEHQLSTMSDLAGIADMLTLGGPPECPQRPFCIPGLRDTYGIEFADFQPLDVGGPLTVAALEEGQIDVGLLFSTSSVIADRGWVLLEDDKELQTAENITPVVSTDVINDEIRDLLNAVSAELTTENMTELNGRVEIEEEDPQDVARDFLENAGLL